MTTRDLLRQRENTEHEMIGHRGCPNCQSTKILYSSPMWLCENCHNKFLEPWLPEELQRRVDAVWKAWKERAGYSA